MKVKDKYYLSNKILGKGSYSCVVKAYLKADKSEVRVCKVIPKKKVSDMKRLKDEIDILASLDHPNIVKIYEYFEDSKCLYLILEMLQGGELFTRIVQEGYLDEDDARNVFKNMIRAVNYCHKQNIVHRDLKPENFMTIEKETWDIKLIDFGLAKNFKSNSDILTTRIGTPYYLAPEVMSGKYDHTCDIWSAGVILYVMLSGSAPFDGKDDDQIYKNVSRGVYNFDSEHWEAVSKEAKDLISSCLNLTPSKRPSAEQILTHPWFKQDCTPILERKGPKIPGKNFLKNYKNYTKFKKIVFSYLAMISSETELKSLKKQFDKLDVNGDGVLSREEIRNGMKNELSIPECDEIFDSMDLDGSGEVEYTEFLTAMMDHKKYTYDDSKILLAFKHLDSDDSGYIEKSELVRIMGSENEQLVDEVMNAIDENGDGKISFTEFKMLMQNESIR